MVSTFFVTLHILLETLFTNFKITDERVFKKWIPLRWSFWQKKRW